MTTLPQTFHPSMPIEIVDDEDVKLLLSRENVDPLVCISVEKIDHQSLEMKHNPPESSHNLHNVTMDEFRRSDVPNMVAHLDDIREGLQSPPPHFSFQDTTSNQHIIEHDETEPQFNFPNQYDDQFANVQRLFPPQSKVHNLDYFQIRKFDNQHTCSTEARFPHQRQASVRVIGEHINEKFRDHRLYKPKEIIHDMQRKFGISCNYYKEYRARHIALEEVQGTPVESYKTNEAWEWYLSRLHKAVSEVDDLVIVSDRKGSITTGVEKVFPNSFHGACAVHLKWNMVGHYGRNKALKQYFRRVARVYRESQFIQHMEQLANINFEAAQYVTNTGIERWARAYSPRKSVFLVAAYSGEIHPVGQPSEWLVPEDIISKIVHPPVGRRGPGRPKKKRIPSFGEEVTQRSCTTCHRVGHNSHTCTYLKASRPSSGMGSISEIGEASRSHDVVE
ncbi:hypothetical protein Ddye_008876 [Dipteronia dyeriana]|uniref:Transposase n=1 Tax=Dipteronia dyeriana TaxID=168575 RepID=A0AAE0CLU3_9ROSI|nr:hypothetical protein Ddye_008876 [Dipteronia dyeriana]